VDVMVDSFLQI